MFGSDDLASRTSVSMDGTPVATVNWFWLMIECNPLMGFQRETVTPNEEEQAGLNELYWLGLTSERMVNQLSKDVSADWSYERSTIRKEFIFPLGTQVEGGTVWVASRYTVIRRAVTQGQVEQIYDAFLVKFLPVGLPPFEISVETFNLSRASVSTWLRKVQAAPPYE